MTTRFTPQLTEPDLARLAEQFPQRLVSLPTGLQVSVRECGVGPAVMCLHGIGSNAASWVHVAQRLSVGMRVIAWDMPGYAGSDALAPSAPVADDYAQVLRALVQALSLPSCVLVGHSLGALVAAAEAQATPRPYRLDGLILVSPARGYGAPGREAMRQKVHQERVQSLAKLGIGGLASERSGRLVSAGATDSHRAWVAWAMAQLNESGYRQAIELLCGADLLSTLPASVPTRVLCGEFDVVTPPEACAEVAARAGVPLELVARAGHASPVEQPEPIARALREMVGSA